MNDSIPSGHPATPIRGDLWWVDFGKIKTDEVRGHEQGGLRPAVVVSATQFNQVSGNATVVPMTRTIFRHLPIHVLVEPPDGGITRLSAVLCDQVRTVSIQRFSRRIGTLSLASMAEIEEAIRIVLDL